MIPIPKKTLAILLVIGIVAGYFLFVDDGVFGDDDGAPQAVIDVYIREVDGTQEGTCQVNTDLTPTQSIFGAITVPMQSFGATLFAVDPNKQYEIEFVITIQADLPPEAPPDTEMFTDADLGGSWVNNEGQTVYFWNTVISQDRMYVSDIPTHPPNYTVQVPFTKANNTHWDAIKNPINGQIFDLMGEYLDGSTWNLNLWTSTSWAGTDAFHGITTADITLTVDTEGNVGITVTDVDFHATEV